MNIYKQTRVDAFPYLEGHMLGDRVWDLTIDRVEIQKVTNTKTTEDKFVVYFSDLNKNRGLIMNKTNLKVLITQYGPETDEWAGKKIGVYADDVTAFGKVHRAVRLCPPSPVKLPATNKENVNLMHGPEDFEGIGDDEKTVVGDLAIQATEGDPLDEAFPRDNEQNEGGAYSEA